MACGLNVSEVERVWKREVYSVTIPLLVVLCVLVIVVNSYVLMSTRWVRSALLSSTLRLAISLCAADTWTSVVVAVSFVINSYLPIVLEYQVPNYGCLALAFEAVRSGGMMTAVLHLLVLAINHYVNTAFPFSSASIMSRKPMLSIVGGLWLLPPVGFFIYFSTHANQGFRSQHCDCRLVVEFFEQFFFRLSIFIMLVAIPFLLMLALYVHIFMILYRVQIKFSHSNSSSDQTNLRQNRQIRRRRKTVVTAFLIMVTFAFGWLPTCLAFLLMCLECPYSFKQLDYVIVFVISVVGNCTILLKSLINPIIYAVRIPEIKGALQTMHSNSSIPCIRSWWCHLLKLSSADHRDSLQENLLNHTAISGTGAKLRPSKPQELPIMLHTPQSTQKTPC